ncbi:MAG: DUF5606 domain-containing protein [Bacteroidaceae bacterium]|nr:DUF5606 domain-containing protein [Bacteroidaceae bacterium]
MKDVILSISGKPGLYRLVAQGHNNLIVETIDAQKKRLVVGARDRVTALNDISMYTLEDDKPLMEIFESCKAYMQAQPTAFSHKEASEAQLTEFMSAVVPNYDADRVHLSDIRKLVQWYNLLVSNGYTEFFNAEEAETAEA